MPASNNSQAWRDAKSELDKEFGEEEEYGIGDLGGCAVKFISRLL